MKQQGILGTIVLGLLPWVAVGIGSYWLRSAIASFVLYHGLCLIAACVNRKHIPSPSEHVMTGRKWIGLTFLCLSVCILTYVSSGYLRTLIDPRLAIRFFVDQHLQMSPLNAVLLSLYFGLINPVIEEYFWRRTIYLRLRQANWAITSSIVVSSLLFGGWHWLVVRLFLPADLAILAVIGIAATGLIFALLYERTKSLAAAILVHSLGADIPIMVYLWCAVLR